MRRQEGAHPLRCHQIRRIRVARGGSFGSEQRDRDADSHLSRHLGHRVHQCVQLRFRDNVHLVFRVEIGLFEDEQHRVRHPVHGRAAHPACRRGALLRGADGAADPDLRRVFSSQCGCHSPDEGRFLEGRRRVEGPRAGRGANGHRRHPAGAFLSEDQACGSLPACVGRVVQRADREFPERQPRHHAQESELHVGPGRFGHVGYGHGRVGGDLHRQPAEQKLQVRNGPDRELPRPDVLPSPVCGVRQHLRGGGDAVRGGPVPVRAEHHHYHKPAESGRNPLPREGDEHIQGGSDRGQFARFYIRRHPVEHLRPEERRPMVRRRNPDTDHDWYRSLRSSQQRKNHR